MSSAVVAAAGSPWPRWAAAWAGVAWLALAVCWGGVARAASAPQDDEAGSRPRAVTLWRLFEEAPIAARRFDAPGLSRDWPNGARVSWPEVFWLDAGQAVASLWRKDGWEAGPAELPRNWAIDVRGGHARRLQPDGQVVCAHDGRMVVVASPVEGQGRLIADLPPPKDDRTLYVGSVGSSGPTGSPPGSFAAFAEARGIDARHPLSRATCDAAPAPTDLDPEGRSSVLRLGHGRLLAFNDRGRAAPASRWTVLDAQRRVVSHWEDACARATWPRLQQDLQPAPWLGGTVSLRSGPAAPGGAPCPWVLVRDDDGRVLPLFHAAAALQRLALPDYRRTLAGISRQGPVWIVMRERAQADPQHAGLFVQDGQQLLKLLSADVYPLGPLSPDGCLLPAAVTPEGTGLDNARDWGRARRAAAFHAIDFCKGDQ